MRAAAQGGDLVASRAAKVPEFDNAAFALDAGEVSEVVRTSFGYHVIKAVSRKDESVPPFAQVKEPIRQRVMAERSQALVQEKTDALAAALRGGRSLEEAAREQGFTAQKSAPLARVLPPREPRPHRRAFEEKGEGVADPIPVPNGYAFIAGRGDPRPAAGAEVQDGAGGVIAKRPARTARSRRLQARAQPTAREKRAAPGSCEAEEPGPPRTALGDLGATRGGETGVFSFPWAAVGAGADAGGWAVWLVGRRRTKTRRGSRRRRPPIASSQRKTPAQLPGLHEGGARSGSATAPDDVFAAHQMSTSRCGAPGDVSSSPQGKDDGGPWATRSRDTTTSSAEAGGSPLETLGGRSWTAPGGASWWRSQTARKLGAESRS